MFINKIDMQVLKLMNGAKITRRVIVGQKEYKYMNEACYKFSEIIGQPVDKLQNLTKNADINRFTFLKTMVNKFNKQKFHNIDDNSEHILNIYSKIEKPSALHLNIVRKTNDSFESLEKIFSLAKNSETLEYVENLQYNELKHSNKASKIIIDLLNSKNRDLYISNPERYSSFIELHADDKNAILKLDELIKTGKYSKLHSDAQLGIKKLFKKQKVDVAMSGKTNDLEKMYTSDRAGFLKSLIDNFTSPQKELKEETKATIVEMYGTLDTSNAILRQAVVERFKNVPTKDKNAEIVEMYALFNKIDKDKDAKKFVTNAINKDLKISSISELNEIIEMTPLKKANIFFNNAKRIIENSSGEERKQALVVELENPFFESKSKNLKKAKMVRMFENKKSQDNIFTKAYKILENKINQYRYYRLSA